uniref:Vps41 beta-propeller domain-containing protein n=1 Tax=Odontella aurita TaxID=265563 RepID=A0A7S4I3E7_9STRA
MELRGGLLAWADSSGVKLYDVDTMSNIAKIDRPRGARPALWPTVSSLRPTLRFERSDSLLIAWGDCIMTMSVREKVVRRGGDDKGGGDGMQQVVKRRIVECGMAWELDCVACGAVPLDSEHVAVLGLVSSRRGDGEGEDEEDYYGGSGGDAAEEEEGPPPSPPLEGTTAGGGNFLELQIISRTAGTVTSSDALPLLSVRSSPDAGAGDGAAGTPAHIRVRRRGWRRLWVPDPADAYDLVSTYCTPRMDDRTEEEEEENSGEASAEGLSDFEANIFNAIAGPDPFGDEGGGMQSSKKGRFKDPHTKWTIRSVTCTDDDDEEKEGQGGGEADEEKKDDNDGGASVSSTDSDDYSFLFRPRKVVPASADDRRTAAAAAIPLPSDPPIMAVLSPHDAVLVRTRDADDAVSHARSAGRHGLALRRALRHRRMIRRHSLNRLIDEYLTALLRLDVSSTSPVAGSSRRSHRRVGRGSMLRRLLLAARAAPILFGTHVDMWKRWAREFARIPGALFVLREHLPVRDPRLPASLYEMALDKMFSDVETMTKESKDDTQRKDIDMPIASPEDAKELFLNALRAWGPISSLRERIKLQKLYGKKDLGHTVDNTSNRALERAEMDLYARMHQSASGYLNAELVAGGSREASSFNAPRKKLDSANVVNQPTGVTYDALFSIRNVALCLHSHVSTAAPEDNTDEPSGTSNIISDIALEGMAELEFMMGHYEESLRLLLTIGARDSNADFSQLEEDALSSIYGNARPRRAGASDGMNIHRSHHVLAMIESHHIHSCLLDEAFLSHQDLTGAAESTPGKEVSDGRTRSPILALILLVGLDLSSHFLVEHTVLPRADRSPSHNRPIRLGAILPINMVSNQLRSRPILLHWYLHQIFVNKPEVYVKFPNTAVPPRSITDLHRSHLELHIKYADDTVYKDRSLADIPAYDKEEAETPLMSFLKAALPHGGTRPDDVRRMLEVCREGKRDLAAPDHSTRPIGSVMHPHLFAKELAFVIEKCGSGTEDDAKIVLLLFLEGAKSLPLAVAYVQRSTAHSAALWEVLVSYCMQPKPTLGGAVSSSSDSSNPEDGSLFGSLLEVSARSGADLAKLILKIPAGMRIEGLRPKLVAAVADYRLKEKIHESSAEILLKDKVDLLRELSHRSRRGRRVVVPPQAMRKGKGVRFQRNTAAPVDGILQPNMSEELDDQESINLHGFRAKHGVPMEMMGSIWLPDASLDP